MFAHPAVSMPRYPPTLIGMSETERLARIADAHRPTRYPTGLTDGLCAERGHPWRCPTYTWAAADRGVLATWDPADDEEAQA
jgi:hypothetical protein